MHDSGIALYDHAELLQPMRRFGLAVIMALVEQKYISCKNLSRFVERIAGKILSANTCKNLK